MSAEPSSDLPGAASVLAVCAHPDDETFGLGAVLDRFVTGGARVSVLCLTHGEASNLGQTGSLHEIRAAELAGAATELGIGLSALLDHPDGELATVPLEQLGAEVQSMVEEVGADILVVFDEGGVTGHPDHCRATEAVLVGAPALPVLAWTLPRGAAETLNTELGTAFTGRDDEEIDFVIAVDRAAQRRAIACHVSQSDDNPVLWRRLELLGEQEALRWLRPPPAASSAVDDRRAAIGEAWDERYRAAPRLFRAEPDQTLVQLVTPLPPGRAVDLGAGEGRNSLWLAASGWAVVAVDASTVALERLARAASEDDLPVERVHEDLATYLAAASARHESFALVVLAFVHPEPEERGALLAAAAGAVGPGGHFFVIGHHLASLGVVGPPDPGRLYTEQELVAHVDGLEVLEVEQRRGESDAGVPGTDVWLWARRPR